MNFEKKKFLLSIFFPILFVGALWLIKISEIILNEDFSGFGLYPLKIKGILMNPPIADKTARVIRGMVITDEDS